MQCPEYAIETDVDDLGMFTGVVVTEEGDLEVVEWERFHLRLHRLGLVEAIEVPLETVQ